MTGKKLEAADHVGEPPQVKMKEIPIHGVLKEISIAPISVNVVRIPIHSAHGEKGLKK
jgi:hypothetical protein